MIEILIGRIIPGVVRLFVFVAAGVFIGSVLESTGMVKAGMFLAKPFMRLGLLPPVSGTAFVVSFVSPRAANSMLAGAYSDRSLSRRNMIISALSNIFPNSFVHLRIMAFILIPLLGYAGFFYVLFQLLSAFICTIIVLVYGRFHHDDFFSETGSSLPNSKRLSIKQICGRAWSRTRKILIRVGLITVPLYIIVAYLDYSGVFKMISSIIPDTVNNILPPSSFVIVAAHMTNIMNAAAAASSLLQSGELRSVQVFLTLVIGYILTMPLRAIRHNIPSAVGIFPGKDGLLIVIISQVMRMFFALLTIILTLTLMRVGLI